MSPEPVIRITNPPPLRVSRRHSQLRESWEKVVNISNVNLDVKTPDQNLSKVVI